MANKDKVVKAKPGAQTVDMLRESIQEVEHVLKHLIDDLHAYNTRAFVEFQVRAYLTMSLAYAGHALYELVDEGKDSRPKILPK